MTLFIISGNSQRKGLPNFIRSQFVICELWFSTKSGLLVAFGLQGACQCVSIACCYPKVVSLSKGHLVYQRAT